MGRCHDPVRQASYVRQVLQQTKGPTALFIGAGCPTAVRVQGEPLIPAICGLTERVCAAAEGEACQHSLSLVREHLLAQTGREPTLEQILTYVRTLRSVVGDGELRGLSADNLDQLDRFACETIAGVMGVPLPGQGTPYHKLAAWVGSTRRAHPVHIFTTNYDLLIEQALEDNRVPYFDGFVGSRRPFFDPEAMQQDDLPARWARVWKLHGSINWRQDSLGAISRGEIVDPPERRLVHPSHLKYTQSRQMPYLAMLDRLRSFFKSDYATMVTCGYSFGDEHLNAVLVQGLQSNPTAIVFALLYGKQSGYPTTVTDLPLTRSNLWMLAEDGATIGTANGAWAGRPGTDPAVEAIAVEWAEADLGGGPEQTAPARFLLGDFSRLGLLLGEIVGQPGGLGEF